MRSTHALSWAALCALLVGVACSDQRPAPLPSGSSTSPVRGGHLAVPSLFPIRSVDPASAFDEGVDPIQRLVFARLVRLTESGQYEGDLADSFDVSSDGRQYTFRLRIGTRFHDGTEVVAQDIKRSFERMLHPKTPCPAPSFYDRIEGFDAFHDGKSPALSGLRVDSDHQVTFLLREPDATFLAVLSLPLAAPVCRSATATYDPSWSHQACGAGPFRLASWNAEGDVIQLQRHDGYLGPVRTYLDSISWHFAVPQLTQRFRFERGEFDLLRDMSLPDSIAFRADPRWEPQGAWSATRSMKGLFLNTEIPPFDNVELRRAVVAALDREAIAKMRGGHVVAADRVVPAGVQGYDPSYPGQRFDLQEALRHMQQAGLAYDPTTGRGGLPNSVDLLVPAESFDLQIAELMQQHLGRVGVRVRLKALAWGAYLAQTGRRRRVSMGSDGWTADFDDPSDFFEPLFHSRAIQDEESQNRAFFSNPQLDDALDRARRELNPAQRRALYQRADEIIRDQAPFAIAYGFRYFEVWQGYVRGYRPRANATLDVASAWVDPLHRAHASRPRSINALAWHMMRGGMR